MLVARAQVGGNFLAGLACNDSQVKEMAAVLGYAMSSSLVLPQNFLGVGGMKIFRDLIYQMRGMMNNKKVRSKLGNKINEGMVAPYRDLL